jgi:hypothetical protein
MVPFHHSLAMLVKGERYVSQSNLYGRLNMSHGCIWLRAESIKCSVAFPKKIA